MEWCSCSSVTLNIDGKDFELSSDMVTVKRYEKTVHVEEFIPSVIEPSFGIGRVMYSLLEVGWSLEYCFTANAYISLTTPLSHSLTCQLSVHCTHRSNLMQTMFWPWIDLFIPENLFFAFYWLKILQKGFQLNATMRVVAGSCHGPIIVFIDLKGTWWQTDIFDWSNNVFMQIVSYIKNVNSIIYLTEEYFNDLFEWLLVFIWVS